MKTVVFGGSGFLGSHVADKLTDRGHDVVIYDCVESPYARPEQKMIVDDILNLDRVMDTVQDARYVYHFAGLADIGKASTEPLQAIQYNVIGTVNVLEACRKWNVQRNPSEYEDLMRLLGTVVWNAFLKTFPLRYKGERRALVQVLLRQYKVHALLSLRKAS